MHRLCWSLKMNYTSKLDEVLALHSDFRRRLCLVKTPSVTVTDVAVAPGAAISGNDHDDVGTSGNVDVAWPALKYNSYMELHDHIEDSRLKGIIAVQFKRLCSKTKDNGLWADTNKHGIAYLLGRDTSQSLLVFVPQNSEGVVVEDGQSVFDFRRYAHKMEDDEGYCRSAQLQAAYTFAKNRMKQNSAMMIDKNESTPKSPPAVKAVPGKTNEKPSSWGIDVGSKAKHVGARIVATLLTPFRGAVASSGTDVVDGADTEKAESDVDESLSVSQATALQSMISPSDVEGAAALQSGVTHPSKPKKKKHRKRKSVTPSPTSRNVKYCQRNERKSNETEGGSRLVLNKSPQYSTSAADTKSCTTNDRTCLQDAIVALVPKEDVISSIYSSMPTEGDTSIEDTNRCLAKHGMVLERVSGDYIKKGGAPLHLLQIQKRCRIIIHIRLVNLKNEVANHFVAWDGSTVFDRPKNAGVNKTSDRATKKSCDAVFERLYPKKQFLSWQITNVYELL